MSRFKLVTTKMFSIMDKTQNSIEAVFGFFADFTEIMKQLILSVFEK